MYPPLTNTHTVSVQAPVQAAVELPRLAHAAIAALLLAPAALPLGAVAAATEAATDPAPQRWLTMGVLAAAGAVAAVQQINSQPDDVQQVSLTMYRVWAPHQTSIQGGRRRRGRGGAAGQLLARRCAAGDACCSDLRCSRRFCEQAGVVMVLPAWSGWCGMVVALPVWSWWCGRSAQYNVQQAISAAAALVCADEMRIVVLPAASQLLCSEAAPRSRLRSKRACWRGRCLADGPSMQYCQSVGFRTQLWLLLQSDHIRSRDAEQPYAPRCTGGC